MKGIERILLVVRGLSDFGGGLDVPDVDGTVAAASGEGLAIG